MLCRAGTNVNACSIGCYCRSQKAFAKVQCRKWGRLVSEPAAGRSVRVLCTPWHESARDQPESADEQYQHYHGFEKTRWCKKNVHVSNYSGEDKERPGDG